MRQRYNNSGLSKGNIIKLDPTKPDTIYTALLYAQQQIMDQEMMARWGGKAKMGTAVIFDQPLYAKAYDIDEASPVINRVFVRLHLIMSYMCIMWFIMKGIEIQSVLETNYALKTVENMLTWHVYIHALHWHSITSAAFTRLRIQCRW